MSWGLAGLGLASLVAAAGCFGLAVAVLARSVRGCTRELGRLRADLSAVGDRLDDLSRRVIAPMPESLSIPTHEAEVVIPAGARHPAGPASMQHTVAATVGGPMVKAAALSFGLRRALSEDRRALIAYSVRRDLKRRRRMRRADSRRMR